MFKAKSRWIVVRLLLGTTVILLGAGALALARGGGGGGHGGGGGGHGGGGGGHGGGGFGGAHVGGFAGGMSHGGYAHVGGYGNFGGFNSRADFATNARNNAARLAWPSYVAGSTWPGRSNWAGTWNGSWVNGQRYSQNYYARYGDRPYGGFYSGLHGRPFWGLGWWWPWWNSGYGGGDYGDYYGYESPYYEEYPVYTDGPVTQQYQQPAYSTADDTTGSVYFSEAANAFRDGDYRDALKLAGHAAIESPQNPKAAELMSLASFALGDYQAAAGPAHAALAFAPPADWASLRAYYGGVAAYTKQLRALEKYCRDNPSAADARFVLGYQYLMTGHPNNAVQQLDQVVRLAPHDKLAAALVTRFESNSTATRPPAHSDVTHGT